jgi:hypothetical protein
MFLEDDAFYIFFQNNFRALEIPPDGHRIPSTSRMS